MEGDFYPLKGQFVMVALCVVFLSNQDVTQLGRQLVYCKSTC